jgi:hypothetical protein
MPQECTWITGREEACPEGGGGIQDIQILGADTFEDQLTSEEAVLTYFRSVGVSIGLLGVTVESISSGEIGTRHWIGAQGAAMAIARKWFRRIYLCKCCRHAETRRKFQAAGLALPSANRVKSGVPDISLLLTIYCEWRTNICRWSW